MADEKLSAAIARVRSGMNATVRDWSKIDWPDLELICAAAERAQAAESDKAAMAKVSLDAIEHLRSCVAELEAQLVEARRTIQNYRDEVKRIHVEHYEHTQQLEAQRDELQREMDHWRECARQRWEIAEQFRIERDAAIAARAGEGSES